MPIRSTLTALLALSIGAFAQGPPPSGRGRGPFGPNGGARLLGGEAGRPERTVKNSPYTADLVTEVTQTLGNGDHIHQITTAHLSRDSEGRTRREQSLSGLGPLGAGARGEAVFITDPIAGVSYTLNPSAKTGSKSSLSGSRRMLPPNGPRPMGPGPGRSSNANIKTDSLGRQMIEGVPADGTRTTLTIPAGAMGNDLPIQVITERWFSPDLQLVVLTKHSDPRSGDTVTKLTNVSRTEPPRTLFEPPVDYRLTETSGRKRELN